MRVLPITCYRPTPQAAPTFASLPYDVFDRAEAAAYVSAHPDSFLAIDRPESTFDPDQDMYAPEVYERAGRLVREKAQDGTLVKDQAPCFYLYQLEQDGHSQVGVVCSCPVASYEDGTIRRHEKTRPEKIADRIQHIRATGAQTGLVFLAYQDDLVVNVIVDAAMGADPLYDFTDEQGVRQRVWRIARPVAVESLATAFAGVRHAYIADGHHRAAASAQLSRELREEAGDPAEELPSDSLLAVLFPASQLTVLAYNRVVHDSAGFDEDGLLQALRDAGFSVGEAQDAAIQPSEARTFGLFAFGFWRQLRCEGDVRGEAHDPASPAAGLDASILQDRVLGPLFDIADPRTSERISFVGGIEGTDGIERRAGTTGVGFSLAPTSVDDLMAVSDAGELMPPKSTWFEPKPRSGLFIRRI